MLENETNPTEFTCQAIGVPLPYIRWYFSGIIINLSNSSKYNISSMVLNDSIIESTFTIIKTESSDVGTYTCEAVNSIGSERSSGVLSVNGEYMHIIMHLHNKQINTGVLYYVHNYATYVRIFMCVPKL